jgi:iron complex transport system substrate-binding protein
MPQLPGARVRRGFFAVALPFLAVLSGPGAEARPQRVVSLNLCADQLLLALADPGQIASLSPLAGDLSISFLAEKAAGIPANEGTGEAILFAGADLVLSGQFGAHARIELLRRQGLEVLVMDPWRDLDDGRRQIRELAGRLGHGARGEALIGQIDAAMARARGVVPAGRSVLTYYRRGFVPSSDSLGNEILRHMGFVLYQEELGLQQGGFVRLETIVSAPPDYVLMDDIAGRSVDNGSALLSHPALARAVPPGRRLVIPGVLGICGGPSTPAMIDALAREVSAKVR